MIDRAQQRLGLVVILLLAAVRAEALPIEEWYRSGDGADFAPAITRAQNAVAVGGTVELELGPRTYPCRSRVDVFRTVIIRGPGVRNLSVEAVLSFNNTTGGVLTHYTGTYGPDAGASSYLTLERVRITGSGSGAGVNLHGIQLQARARLSEVWISAFSGNGVHIDATTPTADATRWIVEDATLTGNGGHGLYTNGTGSGGGTMMSTTVSSNGGYGAYDSTDHAQLGNAFISLYETSNTQGAYRSDASGAGSTWISCHSASGTQLSDLRSPDMVFGGSINRAGTFNAAVHIAQSSWMLGGAAGSSGQLVTSNGSASAPTWQSPADDADVILVDNLTDAYRIREGTNNYVRINTTNAAELLELGNGTTNPAYTLLGTGTLTAPYLSVTAPSGGTAATVGGTTQVTSGILQSNTVEAYSGSTLTFGGASTNVIALTDRTTLKTHAGSAGTEVNLQTGACQSVGTTGCILITYSPCSGPCGGWVKATAVGFKTGTDVTEGIFQLMCRFQKTTAGTVTISPCISGQTVTDLDEAGWDFVIDGNAGNVRVSATAIAGSTVNFAAKAWIQAAL